ncbi:hypothetical protein BZA70DRAFT_248940 [Myxozyma melibiosi]|uniref:DNA-directed RNA polymerase subunit n=1 Tax=Myxozyma melibiosi TaxID=54550 RepID=A0ABR1F4T3_9ASCO
MNISKPIGSEITDVEFGYFTAQDIRNLSVKQITHPQVFDSLGHPISGGLHDLALGAFDKQPCATCRLDSRFCPGHLGHISLPIEVYNPLFFSQMYILLRSTCLYCYSFRLKKVETHRHECKLRLLQYSLISECETLDNMHISGGIEEEIEEEEALEDNRLSSASGGSAKKSKSKSGSDKELMKAREKFVEECIARVKEEGGHVHQSAAVLSERRRLIHELLKLLLARPKCDNCGMFSPTFRKEGMSKVFEISLKEKQAQNNKLKGGYRQDAFYDQGQRRREGKTPEADSESMMEDDETDDSRQASASKASSQQRYVLSTEVHNHLRRLFRKEKGIMKTIFQSRTGGSDTASADMFFIEYLVVPPTKFRPPGKVGGETHEAVQNELLGKILQSTLRIRDLNQRLEEMKNEKASTKGVEFRQLLRQLSNMFVTVQDDVNAFIDSTKSTQGGGRVPPPGIKQLLEKKEGLFRMHMMGKRVNYAARSVISPDPNIETNEIGIPPVFAVKLTYPEPVTAYNFQEMRKCVINGPTVWPGATHIEKEDGTLVALHTMTLEQRTALANQLLTPSFGSAATNKKVYRHIRNQDVVIMNRQPTLHKASMMGHKVKVLPGEKTLRLHYANTNAYNADFDGDEMNMHFPQNENARAEALMLANTDSQYLVPTSGKPLRGLVQDHIVTGVWMTNKDTMFTREQYHQLVYGTLRPEDGHTTTNRILTVPPAIIKPVPMWTGKQIITTMLLNIKPLNAPGLNLISKDKIDDRYWGPGSVEGTVLFMNGQMLAGILDKSQFGASEFGFVHSVHEIYGPSVAGKLLSVLGRLFTKYVQFRGFTCGMDDLRLTADGNKWRVDILAAAKEVGAKAATEVVNLPEDTRPNDPELRRRLEDVLRDANKSAVMDAVAQKHVNAVTSEVVAKCIPDGTLKSFPKNSFMSMVLSGAKGSNVNLSQIMCMLGQQALEGRRVPVMISGKTLPSFKAFDTTAKSGGYIASRFFTGIKPQEFYFHCMAGREGLIDTAVKTSRSGYLQRCLIKQLEGVKTEYDNTVRDSDGSLVQFLYGGDAVEVNQESHLMNFEFCAQNFHSLLQKYSSAELAGVIDESSAKSYAKKVRKLNEKEAALPHYLRSAKYEPTISKFSPSTHMGSVSDIFQKKLDEFTAARKDTIFAKHNGSGLSEKSFKALMTLKYMRSLVHPGEAVGILASQSIGEPSTQMTLNTFHFAGHGAANVTLGIPRMREIIMTASSNIKTPQMRLPVLDDVSDEQADDFSKTIARVVISELIDDVTVTERTGILPDSDITARSYTVRVKFYPRAEYESEYDVSQAMLEHTVTTKFLHRLTTTVTKELKRQKKVMSSDVAGEIGKARKSKAATDEAEADTRRKANDDESDDDDDDDDDDENDDGDATNERLKSRTKEVSAYEEPDDGEKEVLKSVKLDGDDDDEGDEMEVDSKSSPTKKRASAAAEDSESEDEDETAASRRINPVSKRAKERQQEVIGMYGNVFRFDFDDEAGEWCEFELQYPSDTAKLLMINIIESVCRSVVVREIPKIGRCMRVAPAKGSTKRFLVTEGVNFPAMWEQDDFINVDGIRSNNIAEVLRVYGVEAARNTIANEVAGVFEPYGIKVNARHLELIADMMTRDGGYLPFNRHGVEASASPFLKMSFETTFNFLKQAVLNGDVDDVDSPSARLVVGRLSSVGTGVFDVLTKLW